MDANPGAGIRAQQGDPPHTPAEHRSGRSVGRRRAVLGELLDPLAPGGDRAIRRAVFDHRTDAALVLMDNTDLLAPSLAWLSSP